LCTAVTDVTPIGKLFVQAHQAAIGFSITTASRTITTASRTITSRSTIGTRARTVGT
jgi:hypothetical protein